MELTGKRQAADPGGHKGFFLTEGFICQGSILPAEMNATTRPVRGLRGG